MRSRISECVALALAASVEDTLETGPVATIRRAQKHTHTMLHKRRRACTCDAEAHDGAFCVCSSDPPRSGSARDGNLLYGLLAPSRGYCSALCTVGAHG